MENRKNNIEIVKINETIASNFLFLDICISLFAVLFIIMTYLMILSLKITKIT